MPVFQRKKTMTVDKGSYIEQGKKNQNLIIEWFRLSALSEEFADKMTS